MATNRLVINEQIDAYASTLLDAAEAAGGQACILDIRDQLDTIAQSYRGNFELKVALTDRMDSTEQRKKIAQAVFADAHPVLSEVVAVMVERENMELIQRVYQRYNVLLQERLDVVIVDVTTVVELTDALREQIKAKAKRELGKEVVLRERINPAILGGIVMNAAGRTIDASMISQLERARNTLKAKDGGEC